MSDSVNVIIVSSQGHYVMHNVTCNVTKPRGYAIQHIPVPVPSQYKLVVLRQEGHPA